MNDKAKLPEAQLNALWETRNESLRQMGVKLVPMPEWLVVSDWWLVRGA